MLSFVTVAARFKVGELANSDGEMGAGKLLWLKRPTLGRSADMALNYVFLVQQQTLDDRHGFQDSEAVDTSELQSMVTVFMVAVFGLLTVVGASGTHFHLLWP